MKLSDYRQYIYILQLKKQQNVHVSFVFLTLCKSLLFNRSL